jgi:Mg2+-importing ATPase
VVSASAIVLIIRSRKPFFKSRPGKYLLIATITVIISTFILPFTPLSSLFCFTPMPLYFLGVVLIIVFFYGLTAEVAKALFYKYIPGLN